MRRVLRQAWEMDDAERAAFLNFASKRGVGAGAGVKLAGHDPLFLRLLINRALTKSPTAEIATMQPTTWRPDK